MRLYKVYYAIKRDGYCYLHNMTVGTNNRQQALENEIHKGE